MKKIIALIAALMLMLTLFAGCSAKQQYVVGIGQFGPHASLDNCREGFIEGLRQAGIVEGENLKIILQDANFDPGTSNIIAQSFISSKVDLICAIATPMAQAAFNAAEEKKIPVIFNAVTDPVAAGLTEGEVTGTSDELPVEAQLKLIRAMMPEAKNIGILYTTSETNSVTTIAQYKALAGKYGFNIVETGISTPADIPLATANILSKVDCMTNLTDNTVVGSLATILDAANAKKIPVFGSEIEQVKIGCVASEGLEYFNLGVQTGLMAAKVLKGEAKASEIPFEIIADATLYINSDVMADMGLTLPDDYMSRAKDVKG